MEKLLHNSLLEKMCPARVLLILDMLWLVFEVLFHDLIFGMPFKRHASGVCFSLFSLLTDHTMNCTHPVSWDTWEFGKVTFYFILHILHL